MSAIIVEPPFEIFTDIDGQPLEAGFVWIGTANLDPQTNPIQVYWDQALTIPAAQPLRTIGGYVVNSGTPSRIFVDGVAYSIRVMNKNGSTIYSEANVTGVDPNASGVVYDPAGSGAVPTTVQAKLREEVSVKDFGAVGDGVADDTAAIQAAINFAFTGSTNEFNGGAVYFPKGRYKVSAPIVLFRRGIHLYGEGRGSIIFIDRSAWPVNSGIFYSTFNNRAFSYTANLLLENLYFYAYDPANNAVYADPAYTPIAGCNAIRFTGMTGAGGPGAIRDCFFKGFDTAIAGFAWWAVEISNNVFVGKKGLGTHINLRNDSVPESTAPLGSALNSVTIKRNWILGAEWGIRTWDQSVNSLVVTQNTFEQIDRGMQQLGSKGTIITNNYWEGVDRPLSIGSTTGSVAGTVQGIIFTGNFLNATSGESRLHTIDNGVFKDNWFDAPGNEYWFPGTTNDWIKNTEIEYTNGINQLSVQLASYRAEKCVIYQKDTGYKGGAIINGSNANGDFTRYPDGTQSCTYAGAATTSFSRSNHFGSTAGTMFAVDAATRSWPANFVAIPAVSVNDRNTGSSDTNAIAILKVPTASTSQFQISIYHKDNGLSVPYSVIGIGRWF
jgi:hypothetical protein